MAFNISPIEEAKREAEAAIAVVDAAYGFGDGK